jgi:hypothetical protein
MLRLHDLRDTPESRATIAGLVSVQSAPGIARIPGQRPGVFVRGLDINLTFDPQAWRPGLYLIGAVLERFLALQVSVNGFVRTRALMETGVLPPEPGIEDRVRVMSRHLDLMVEVFGERHGCVMFRKIGPWYAKRFGPANEFSKKIVRMESRSQYLEIVDAYLRWRRQFCDDSGHLLPRYQLAPMVASFMRDDGNSDEPASIRREAIPVPKGPVEVW